MLPCNISDGRVPARGAPRAGSVQLPGTHRPRTYAALRPAEAVALRPSSCTLPARGWGQLTLTASLPRSARLDWQRNPTRAPRPQTPPGRRHQDSPHPPATRPPPAPAPADLRGRRRRAAVPGRPRRPAQRKPLRPDLAPGPHRHYPQGRDRHPAGTPPLRPSPCRAVAVAGLRRPARRDRCPRRAQRACPPHHLRPLHTRLRPDRQPALDRVLRPSQRPPAGPQEPAQTPGIPSVMRPCHSWTQQDTAGPGATTQIRLDVLDLRKCRLEDSAHRSRARAGRSRAPALQTSLTSQDLAHHWPTATGNGLPNRSRTRIRPGIQEHRHRV